MFGDTLDKIEIDISTIESGLLRLRRLRSMIVDEFEKLQNASERVGVHTEAEAAAILKLDGGHKHLARLRREHNLPHVSIGRNACYTSAQIAEICDLFTVNKVRQSALKKAA